MPAAVRLVQPGSDLSPGDPADGRLARAPVTPSLHEAQAQNQGTATRRKPNPSAAFCFSLIIVLQLSPCTGLTVPGHRRFLFLCLVRLVSTAPRVEEPEKTPRRHQRGQHPAGSGRAARAGDHDARVPSAQHGFLTPAAGTVLA